MIAGLELNLDAKTLAQTLELTAFLAAVWAVARSKRLTQTVELTGKANDELRKELDDMARRNEQREADRKAELDTARAAAAARDRACQAQLDELRGRIDVLTSDLGRDIGRHTAAVVIEHLEQHLEGQRKDPPPL